MIRVSVLVMLAMCLVVPVRAEAPPDVPTLTLSATWPEQSLEKNVIHRTRPPRGGVFEVVARIDAAGVAFYRWQRARVSLSTQPALAPVKVLVDGVERAKPETTLGFRKLEGKKELRWRFHLPWTVRKAEPEYTFVVKVELPNRWADLKKSITVSRASVATTPRSSHG